MKVKNYLLTITIAFLPLTMFGQYCDASTTQTSNYITRVTFEDIDNNIDAHNPYNDYTSQSTAMASGGQGTLVINTKNDHWTYNALGAWIDWDNNGDFGGANEEVLHIFSEGPYNVTVTVPAGAVEGVPLRMRVRMGYGAESKITPCGEDTYFGEVEDYTVTVSSVLGVTDNKLEKRKSLAYPMPFLDTFTVNLSKFTGQKVNISVFDMQGKLVEQKKIEESPNEITLGGEYSATGNYLVRLESGSIRETLNVIKQ